MVKFIFMPNINSIDIAFRLFENIISCVLSGN